jgi:hypothetical protein
MIATRLQCILLLAVFPVMSMVACICPMGVELSVMEAMLDDIHESIPSSRDQNTYTGADGSAQRRRGSDAGDRYQSGGSSGDAVAERFLSDPVRIVGGDRGRRPRRG